MTNKILISALRKIMPNVLAQQIIGVQPITGSASQISSLKPRYGITVIFLGIEQYIIDDVEKVREWAYERDLILMPTGMNLHYTLVNRLDLSTVSEVYQAEFLLTFT